MYDIRKKEEGDNMTEFYLVRHGKTKFNLEGRFQGGKVDSDLLDTSIAECTLLGKKLKKINFDLLITSQQGRAVETGEIVLNENQYKDFIEKRRSKKLNEIDFGIWDGVLEEEILFPEQLFFFRNQPEKFDTRVIDGEHYYEVYARVRTLFDNINNEFPDGKILVISHGMTLLSFAAGILKLPYAQLRELSILDNNSLSIISTSEGKWWVKQWNNKKF